MEKPLGIDTSALLKNIMMTVDSEISKEEFIRVCEECKTKQDAYIKLNMHRNTFEKYLHIFNYEFKSKRTRSKYPIEDIFSGKYNYPTSKLNKRLLKEGYKEYKCEVCGNTEWLGKPIPLELHHIDGDSRNNSLENLMLLCPNCHSQTDNFKSKNIKHYKNLES